MLHNFSLFLLLPATLGILLPAPSSPASRIPPTPYSPGLPPPCPPPLQCGWGHYDNFLFWEASMSLSKFCPVNYIYIIFLSLLQFKGSSLSLCCHFISFMLLFPCCSVCMFLIRIYPNSAHVSNTYNKLVRFHFADPHNVLGGTEQLPTFVWAFYMFYKAHCWMVIPHKNGHKSP